MTWDTYHVGFALNLWRFVRGWVPDEHALPRSILVDGRWHHMPHAVQQPLSGESAAEDNTGVRAVPVAAMARHSGDATGVSPGGRSTHVSLMWHGGRALPTTAAEVAAFSEQSAESSSSSSREAYTRPVRIIGKTKQQQQQHGQHGSPMRDTMRELDTDDDERDGPVHGRTVDL